MIRWIFHFLGLYETGYENYALDCWLFKFKSSECENKSCKLKFKCVGLAKGVFFSGKIVVDAGWNVNFGVVSTVVFWLPFWNF